METLSPDLATRSWLNVLRSWFSSLARTAALMSSHALLVTATIEDRMHAFASLTLGNVCAISSSSSLTGCTMRSGIIATS
eukprot:5139957-Prorocentrum_lima.AAC.1